MKKNFRKYFKRLYSVLLYILYVSRISNIVKVLTVLQASHQFYILCDAHISQANRQMSPVKFHSQRDTSQTTGMCRSRRETTDPALRPEHTMSVREKIKSHFFYPSPVQSH